MALNKDDKKEILRLKAKIKKALHGEPFIYSELALKDLCRDFGFLRGTPITDKKIRGIKKL